MIAYDIMFNFSFYFEQFSSSTTYNNMTIELIIAKCLIELHNEMTNINLKQLLSDYVKQ